MLHKGTAGEDADRVKRANLDGCGADNSSGAKKWNLREAVSRRSDSRNSEDTTNEGRFTARNTAAFTQSGYSVKAVE